MNIVQVESIQTPATFFGPFVHCRIIVKVFRLYLVYALYPSASGSGCPKATSGEWEDNMTSTDYVWRMIRCRLLVQYIINDDHWDADALLNFSILRRTRQISSSTACKVIVRTGIQQYYCTSCGATNVLYVLAGGDIWWGWGGQRAIPMRETHESICLLTEKNTTTRKEGPGDREN